MGERFSGDGAAANGFGRRSLHGWEAHLLHEANCPAPPDMRAPGRWRLSAEGVPVPPLPDATHPDYFHAEIERLRASLSEEQRSLPEYDAGNHQAWAAYFERRQAQRLASTNNAPVVSGNKNSDGCRLWWGAPGLMLHAVLEYLEGSNDLPLTYPATLVPRRSGGQWAPRRMLGGSSSSSSSSRSSSHSSGSPALFSVKAEPAETPLGRRTRSAGIVINEGRASSSAPPRLVKPKPEPGLTAVKTEPELDDEAALKWAREDWARLEMERQRRAYEEIAARRRGRDQGGVVVLEDSDDDAPPPAKPVRQGDPGQGSSSGRVKKEPVDDDDGDYAAFSEFFGL